jgi:hypothetical protein
MTWWRTGNRTGGSAFGNIDGFPSGGRERRYFEEIPEEIAARKVGARVVYQDVIDMMRARRGLDKPMSASGSEESWFRNANDGLRGSRVRYALSERGLSASRNMPFEDLEDGANTPRPTTTRRRSGTSVVLNTRSGDWTDELFGPDKLNQPNARPRDRLSGLFGTKESGGGSILSTAFGGTGGMESGGSSYKVRALVNSVKSINSRIRLSNVGFAAILFSQAYKQEIINLNNMAAKNGKPGGILTMSDEEIGALGYSRSDIYTKAAGSVVRRGLSQAADVGNAIIYGGASIIAGMLGYTDAANKYMRFYAGVSAGLEGWAEGGAQGLHDAVALAKEYGSMEAYRAHQENLAKAEVSGRQIRRFFRNVAAEIAGSIIGVNGPDAYGELVNSTREMQNEVIEQDGVTGLEGFGRARGIIRAGMGTKE